MNNPEKSQPDDPDQLLEQWIQDRRENVPEVPVTFRAEVLRLLKPPPRQASRLMWGAWIGRMSLLAFGAVCGVARSYAAVVLLFGIREI